MSMSYWRCLVSILLPLLCLLNQTLASTISSTPVPPLTILPSLNWNGIDGNWSSFWLTVGTPYQPVQIFISTASNQPWVISPDGCTPSDPGTCLGSRGLNYNSSGSTTWVPNTINSEGEFALELESNLGLAGDGYYGSDTIMLGSPGSGSPSLSSQVLATITTHDFWLGLFGLNPAPTNFSGKTEPVPSYMSNLKSQGHIPSLSYGYTAGAYYRNGGGASGGGVFANLTLGGYEESLIVPNNLTVDFATNGNDLTIDVNTITVTSTGGKSQVISSPSSSFPAFIDSSIPYLYLPTSICQKFEEALGITYDTQSELYLLNDAQYTTIVAKNASVTFTLTNSTSKAMVNITLPYAAFDWWADYPIVEKSTRYFPLKRAVDDSQITLGRVFLQEAYLIADYERSQFSVHQRNWSTFYPASSPTTISPLQTPATSSSSSKSGISTSAIAAIVLAILVSIALTLCLTIYILRRVHQRKQAPGWSNTVSAPSSISWSLTKKDSFRSAPSSPLPLPFISHKDKTDKKSRHVSKAPSELSFFDKGTNSVLLTPSNRSTVSLNIGKAIGSPNLTLDPRYNNSKTTTTRSPIHNNATDTIVNKNSSLVPTEPKPTFHLASLSTRRKERKKKQKEKAQEIYELSGGNDELCWAELDEMDEELEEMDMDSRSNSPALSALSFASNAALITSNPAKPKPWMDTEREVRGSGSILHMGMNRDSGMERMTRMDKEAEAYLERSGCSGNHWAGNDTVTTNNSHGRESHFTNTTMGMDTPTDGVNTSGTWEFEKYLDPSKMPWVQRSSGLGFVVEPPPPVAVAAISALRDGDQAPGKRVEIVGDSTRSVEQRRESERGVIGERYP
ncbi:911f14ec-e970-4108-9906-f13cae20c75a [Sclerotinia trifoliorum]|uniref:911f14ec-e970-4108-9906-f13cae20c75a n=1 Tax=Sclerotinia trifoliorum TaxID=28548 RepID=A0A8H2VVZ3_9HELO|nr:911f14ec-e970-4108-9906-f13cae20c75a [Sclerotinia trifoliorum]